MKEQIKKVLEYAKDLQHAQDDESYLSDGEVLDIVIEHLERILK